MNGDFFVSVIVTVLSVIALTSAAMVVFDRFTDDSDLGE